MTGTGRIVEVQGTAEKIPFTEEQFLELLALGEKGRGQARRPAEDGGDVSVLRRHARACPSIHVREAGQARPSTDISTGRSPAARDRDPQSGQAARNARTAGALRHRGGVGRRARPRASRRRPARRFAPMHASRRKPPPRRPACRPSRTIPGSRSMRSAASPASTRRAGPARTRISARDATRRRRSCIERGAIAPDRRRAHFVSALCVAWPDGHLEEFEAHGRRHAGLAAARRRWASATIRCSCRTAMPAPSARCRARRSTACRRAAKACRTAPAPSSSWRRRVLSSDEHRAEHSASTSTGRSACRNARIATSTATCAMPPIDEARFVRAFTAEIAATAARVPGRTVSTIFFGGGTPSLMQPATVGAILDAIARHWTVAPDVEVTLEANPTSVEATRFRGYRAAGVNRVSLGVQALDDAALKAARPAAHRARGARRGRGRARDLRALFVRPDLCAAGPDAGRPGPPSSSARSRGRRASVALSAHHRAGHAVLRAACGRQARRRRTTTLARAFYDTTQDVCAAAGLPAYEISNHARPGAECRHNLVYWRAHEYAGIGPGAHGRLDIDGERHATATEKRPETWLMRVEVARPRRRHRRGAHARSRWPTNSC